MLKRDKRYLVWIVGLLLVALAVTGCEREDGDPVGQAAAMEEEAGPTAPRAVETPAAQGADVHPTEPALQPTPASIAPGNEAMVLGAADASVTIVEFSDYQCPYCARYFVETWPRIKSEYVDTGRVRYVFKDFPLTSIHPKAPQAHVAARCAGDQEAYWGMHDRLFEGQSVWADASDVGDAVQGFAADLGLEESNFAACLEDGRWSDAVEADLAEGARLGVRGTPTFFINGYPLVGAQPFSIFQRAIELAEEGRLGEAFGPRQ